ncbi:MAG: Fic family protein [Bacteroidota bacterium]
MSTSKNSTLSELLNKVDQLKREIDKYHPLPLETENRIFQKLRLDWNYNSNAIEGNTLNYGETFAFLMHGITAHGKPLKDYLDIKGHNEAINYLVNFIRNKEELTEAVIRELHKVILVESYEIDAITPDGLPTKKTVAIGTYKKQANHVKTATGEVHYFASPEETPAKMNDLMMWYRKTKDDKEVHPVILAALFHHKFVEIHPFDDGNGRMARLLMNLILMQNNFPPTIIKISDKNNYYLALSQADAGNNTPFIEYVASVLIHSQEIYLKGARGESIEEPDDVDKEIILLKQELESRDDRFEKFNSHEVRIETLNVSIMPLIKSMSAIIIKFKDLFGIYSSSYRIYYNSYQSRNERSKLLTIEESYIEHDLSSLRESVVNSIDITFKLDKFKIKENQFTLALSVEIIFLDFEFIALCKLFESYNNIKQYKIDNRIHEGQWLEKISYEKQINKDQLEEAQQIISKEIISYIKTKKQKD